MRHHFVRSSAGLRDPNFKNVTLLLHGDGTNGAQNNTFLDSSGSNNTITRTGNVAQGSFGPYGDRWSNYFDGSGDRLTLSASSSFNFSSAPNTFEFWIYPLALPGAGNYCRVLLFGTNDTTGAFVVQFGSSGNVGFGVPRTGYTSLFSAAGTIEVNKWQHFAFIQNGTNSTIYKNGILVASGTVAAPTSANNDLKIGYDTVGTVNFNFLGYLSNIRVVKGSAVYVSDFKPSSEPLTAITNTSLLTCQSNRFRDASSNNFAITRVGDVSVQRFSPFSPDAEYRTDRIGGGAYFDGTGDWLQVANRGLKLTAGFFTAECWVYITAYSGNFYALFDDRYWQGGHNGGWCVFINSIGQIVMQASNGNWNNWGGTFITSSNSVIRGQWNHVAIVRGANDLINIYINGISTTTPVAKKDLNLNSGSAQSAWESRIGIHASDIVFGGTYYYPLPGTISDLRVINGKCLYTANFTPPTEPLTAIPETTFLGRFANASIVDNAMMSNIETVGNAQISTSIKKFGTGSLRFDGTGDYLTLPLSENYRLGTGDFTIEMWVYFNFLTGYQCLIDLRNGTVGAVGPVLYTNIGSPTILRFYTAGADRISTSALSTALWYHIALTRSGTSTKLFVNGNQEGSTYTDSNNYIINSPRISVFSNDPNAGFINGYVDDLRITKGVARYTSNFTPPTAPFPDF